MATQQKSPTEIPTATVWFLKRENVRRILGGLFIACGGFVVLEKWPGFYAVFGFVACVILVLISRFVLRPLVMRDEDYYDRNSPEEGGETDA
jgi:uncharacterized membrane protein